MATMTLKNVPDALYAALKRSAARHRRSINGEAIVCLERALLSPNVDPENLLSQASSLRARAGNLFVTDADLRLGRDEGRP
jgi:antitoxin FitA